MFTLCHELLRRTFFGTPATDSLLRTHGANPPANNEDIPFKK
jgi:hypothetical protein